jgi:hypothetical protein
MSYIFINQKFKINTDNCSSNIRRCKLYKNKPINERIAQQFYFLYITPFCCFCLSIVRLESTVVIGGNNKVDTEG